MASSSYGVYEGLPLPHQTSEKRWVVSAATVDESKQNEHLPIRRTSNISIKNPVCVEQYHHQEEEKEDNGKFVRRSNKVATYRSPSGIVTIQGHQEMHCSSDGSQSVSHMRSHGMDNDQVQGLEYHTETVERHRMMVSDPRREPPHTHASEINQSVHRPPTRRSSQHHRNRGVAIESVRGDDAELIQPMVGAQTGTPSNRHQIRMEQREKIKQEIERRREPEMFNQCETQIHSESVPTSIPTTQLMSTTKKTSSRHSNMHANHHKCRSVSEEGKEKHGNRKTLEHEIQVHEKSSRRESPQRQTSAHHKEKVKKKTRITETDQDRAQQSKVKSMEQETQKHDASKWKQVRDKVPKRTTCGICGLAKKRKTPVINEPKVKLEDRTGTRTRQTATQNIRESTLEPKIYSQLDEDSSDEFYLENAPIMSEKAQPRTFATKTKSKTSDHKKKTNSPKKRDDKSSSRCCIS